MEVSKTSRMELVTEKWSAMAIVAPDGSEEPRLTLMLMMIPIQTTRSFFFYERERSVLVTISQPGLFIVGSMVEVLTGESSASFSWSLDTQEPGNSSACVGMLAPIVRYGMMAVCYLEEGKMETSSYLLWLEESSNPWSNVRISL